MGALRYLVVCMNPTLQRTIVLPRLWENEVNRSDEYYLDASGKGVNTTRILHQLGEEAVHLTHAGGRNRDYYVAMAEESGVAVRWVESHREIRYCYTLLNRSSNTTTEIVEEAVSVESGTEERATRLYGELIDTVDVVIIAGSKAPGFSSAFYPQMVRTAKAKRKTVALDLRGDDLTNALEYAPDIIAPNFAEFAKTFFPDMPVKEDEDNPEAERLVAEKMLELRQSAGCLCVLSRGGRPAMCVADGRVEHVSAQCIAPVNTIGSGDAFTAGFASAYLRGRDVVTAVAHAHDCAAKNALLVRPGYLHV